MKLKEEIDRVSNLIVSSMENSCSYDVEDVNCSIEEAPLGTRLYIRVVAKIGKCIEVEVLYLYSDGKLEITVNVFITDTSGLRLLNMTMPNVDSLDRLISLIFEIEEEDMLKLAEQYGGVEWNREIN